MPNTELQENETFLHIPEDFERFNARKFDDLQGIQATNQDKLSLQTAFKRPETLIELVKQKGLKVKVYKGKLPTRERIQPKPNAQQAERELNRSITAALNKQVDDRRKAKRLTFDELFT